MDREGLALDPQLVVHADRQMLGSALSNLLQNAFKFSPRDAHVSLTVQVDAGRTLFDVADECGGLPEGDVEDLFRPFEQRGGDRTGIGFGLSISRRAVEANGGHIRVRNLPGHGCVFTIDLPRGATPA